MDPFKMRDDSKPNKVRPETPDHKSFNKLSNDSVFYPNSTNGNIT